MQGWKQARPLWFRAVPPARESERQPPPSRRRCGRRGGRRERRFRLRRPRAVRGSIGAGSAGRDPDLHGTLRKPEHLDLQGPDAIGQFGEGIGAVVIRSRDEFPVTLRGGDGGAGDGKAAGFDNAVMFRGEKHRHGQTGRHQPPEKDIDTICSHGVVTHKGAVATPNVTGARCPSTRKDFETTWKIGIYVRSQAAPALTSLIVVDAAGARLGSPWPGTMRDAKRKIALSRCAS